VANELAATFENVAYFPSYEIIIGHFNKGSYFEDDLRLVKKEGVDHVMRVFMKYLVADSMTERISDHNLTEDIEIVNQIELDAEIICDEELIAQNL
jgi:hypothetical protein